MNTFYEPSENIAGIAHRAGVSVRRQGGVIKGRREFDDDQVRHPDGLTSLKGWVRQNFETALWFAVISAFFLYEIFNRK